MNTSITPTQTTLSPFERLHGMMEDIFPSSSLLRGTWNPAVDIKETDNSYTFLVELPGMNSEDLDVEITGEMLVIRGKREESNEDSKEGYLRKERYFGSFYWSFRIDGPIQADKVEASYNKGILEVVVPKNAQATSQRIQVK
ncbi:MAG: hypothetical protein BGO01_00525 [Armatimonadetes bacterium 55-13]|nr:Hsp20/alpha crystallin family protein [Armatimonadota bacterium]OJU62084.1 MAG: hypothetical protein BGO01_00525 [Armatimonadetes bacterium 55-13]